MYGKFIIIFDDVNKTFTHFLHVPNLIKMTLISLRVLDKECFRCFGECGALNILKEP